MTHTAPFYRRGNPVPLTVEDYARRAGVTLEAAQDTLRTLAMSGAVTSSRTGTNSLRIYEVRQ